MKYVCQAAGALPEIRFAFMKSKVIRVECLVVFGRFDSVISINRHHSRSVFPLRMFANKSSTCISW